MKVMKGVITALITIAVVVVSVTGSYAHSIYPIDMTSILAGLRFDFKVEFDRWERAVVDTIQMDKAVEAVKAFAQKRKDTLVLVVADHIHRIKGVIADKHN